MTTVACFGDSYLGMAEAHLAALATAHGFTLDTRLIDPSQTPLTWLLYNQQRIADVVNSLPDDTVWVWSTGGIDALNGQGVDWIGGLLNQLIHIMDDHPILHLGYEWWPPVSGTDAKMEPFYAVTQSFERRNYQFLEMRGVVPFNDVEYVDILHLSDANYLRRTEHLWDCYLRAMV